MDGHSEKTEQGKWELSVKEFGKEKRTARKNTDEGGIGIGICWAWAWAMAVDILFIFKYVSLTHQKHFQP